MKCTICGKQLKGKQTKFCSMFCKNKCSNFIHQTHAAQKKRGLQRKLELMKAYNFRCQRCGYDANISCLSFHHRDPSTKLVPLSSNFCANRTMETLLEEVKKCDLLCLNCHTAEHNPSFSKDRLYDQIEKLGTTVPPCDSSVYETDRDAGLSIPVTPYTTLH